MAIHTLNNIEKQYKAGQMIVTIIETGESINLSTYKIYLSSKPNIPNGARNIKVIKTMGRTGFLPLDLNTTRPIEFSIELSSLHADYGHKERNRTLFEKLEGRMLKIEFYSEPFVIYEGFMTDIEFMNVGKFSSKIKATIHAQPYRLYNHDLGERITLDNGDSFRFDKGFVKPRLIMTGNGDITISHDVVDMRFQAVPNDTPIIIDCVNKMVYSSRTKNTLTHYGHLKINKPYIEIRNRVPITWSGNISNLEFEFDWRSVN